jgi:ribose transport system substrate-binding protein
MNTQNDEIFQKKITRQYIVLLFTLIFMVLTLLGGSLYFKFYKNALVKQGDAREYGKYFVMIADNYKSDFLQSVYKGALQAAKDENIYLDLLGENLQGGYTTKELMRIAIDSKVDGIIVDAGESDEMTALIDEATHKNIPVVTLYNDSTHSERVSFVGVGGYSVGKLYGKQIVNIIKEKRRQELSDLEKIDDRKQIQIAVLVSADATDAGQNIIIASMQDTIRAENATDSEFSVSIVAIDNTNNFSVEESIRDIFLHEEVPDVIVCLNELTTVCAYQAVVDFNMVGDVNILGYYASEDIVKAIERGGIYATIAVDTTQLGQYCIEALYDYIDSGNTSEYYLADIMLIDGDNVENFIKKEEENEEIPQ